MPNNEADPRKLPPEVKRGIAARFLGFIYGRNDATDKAHDPQALEMSIRILQNGTPEEQDAFMAGNQAGYQQGADQRDGKK